MQGFDKKENDKKNCESQHVMNMFTFGKILEKHSSSSSVKLIWGRNISVMIFRTPVETLCFLEYSFLEQKVLRLAAKCNEETYVYDHPNSLSHDAKSSSS